MQLGKVECRLLFVTCLAQHAMMALPVTLLLQFARRHQSHSGVGARLQIPGRASDKNTSTNDSDAKVDLI